MGSQPPEIIIIGEDGYPEAPSPDRAPRPGSRRWAALVIGAVLIFVLGIAVGGHVRNTPGTALRMTSPSTSASTTSSESSTTRNTADATSAAGEPLPTADESGGPVIPGSTAATDPLVASMALETSPTPGSTGWELVGYRAGGSQGLDPGAIVRFDPTGTVVTTSVPPLYSNGSISFAATDSGAIVMPGSSSGDGYVVIDGRAATDLPGDMHDAWVVLPGADGQHVWVARSGGDGPLGSLDKVALEGTATGTSITVPQAISSGGMYSLSPDGAGNILASGTGGAYRLSPDGAQLVTHGQVLAAGPTGFLVWECDDAGSCTALVVDRADGERRPVPGYTDSSEFSAQGLISPDGRHAAMFGLGDGGPSVRLIDLRSGDTKTFAAPLPQGYLDNSTTLTVFTLDSKYLLAATANGVVPIDVASGRELEPLPAVPPLAAIAIRSVAPAAAASPETPPPTPSSTASPTSPVSLGLGPDPKATDSLVAGYGFGIDRGEGQVTIAVQLQSITDDKLVFDGHIQFLGPDGQPMPGSSSRLVTGWDYQLGSTPPAPLAMIMPRQHLEIVITADIDCNESDFSANWWAHSPTVVIPLRGFTKPWTRTLESLIASPADNLRTRLCG